MTILISALVLGFTGSFHCAGMCGPIAISLPLFGNTIVKKIAGGILYNIGRTITYGIIGALFGLLGQGIVLSGFQQKISILMGVLMIISALFPSIFKSKYQLNRTWMLFVNKLKSLMGSLLSTRSFLSLFYIGLLNGLLPCGLVYIAVAGAIGAGDFILGIFYMILFGIGTIPMLLSISIAGNILSLPLRNKINKLIPILVILIGLFFVLRGLNLGIPYLSPPREKIEKKFNKSLKSEELSFYKSQQNNCYYFKV